MISGLTLLPYTLAFQLGCLLRKHLGSERGQAMVEYSTLTFFILVGLAGAGFAVPVNGENLVTRLYSGFQVYVDSMFYCLALAVT